MPGEIGEFGKDPLMGGAGGSTFPENKPSFDQLSGGGGESPDRDEEAQEYARRQAFGRFMEDQPHMEILRTESNPQIILYAAREIGRLVENGQNNLRTTVSPYVMESVLTQMSDRAGALELGKNDLIKLGLVEPNSINEDTSEAIFTHRGFAYKNEIKQIKVKRGETLDPQGKVISIQVENVDIPIDYIGSDDQRKFLSDKLKIFRNELETRKELSDEHVWLIGNTENLSGLTEFYYRVSCPTETAMNNLCNAEGQPNGAKKTEGGVEYREGKEFGDTISVALQLHEIVGTSEDYQALKDLVRRPGMQFLFNVTEQEIDDLFLRPDGRKNREIKTILKEWIGEPWKWVDSDQTPLGGGKRNRKNKDDLELETNDLDSRGLLTRCGNINVGTEWPQIMEIRENIRRFIAGGENVGTIAKRDGEAAENISWEFFRISAKSTELGGAVYKDKGRDGVERVAMHHDMGGMTSDDRVKVLMPEVFRSVYKYLKPGETRDWGPEGSFGKYPRFAVNYFKTWKTEVDGVDRSFDELRWGYREDDKAQFLGRLVTKPREEALRLGELPWNGQTPKLFNRAALGIYIAGRDIGIFPQIMNTSWKGFEDFKDKDFWTKLAKALGISVNAQTAIDGKYRDYLWNGMTEEQKRSGKEAIKNKILDAKKQTFKAFWDGLISLPQWGEWIASEMDRTPRVGVGKIQVASPELIKNNMLFAGILSKEEIEKLPRAMENSYYEKYQLRTKK